MATLNAVAPGPSFRVKLLADFAQQHSPSQPLAAPGSTHTQNLSFVSSLVESDNPSAMLISAMETLSLSYIADTSTHPQWMRLPLQESYARLLSLLRAAMAHNPRTQPVAQQHELLASMVALSLIPGQLDGHHRMHLVNAAAYLAQNGPSALGAGETFDSALLRHISLYVSFLSLAERRAIVSRSSAWEAFPGIMVHPPPQYPAATRYIPWLTMGAEFVLFSL